MKDLLLNVGSGGGAAAAAAPGGAAAGGAAAEEEKEEEKEEGWSFTRQSAVLTPRREGGVRRRHGLRSVRLVAHTFFRPGSVTSAWGCMMYFGNAWWSAGSCLRS